MTFYDCTGLISVTFQGTITSNNFSNSYSFPGDLCAKYLAGGPGTYTRPNASSQAWTKLYSQAESIEYDNHTTRSRVEIEKVMQEITVAYNENITNCRNAIALTGKQDNWMIDLCEPKAASKAEIKDGKLHIWFSMILYDDFEKKLEDRLKQIGEELRYRILVLLNG